MRWRDRFLFTMEAVGKAETESGERKGHYLNVTAGTMEDIYQRAEFAKELGAPIIMSDFLTMGFTAHTSLSRWCRDNGMLLHCHRAFHAVIDRQKNHGIHWRVLAKWLRMAGGDHVHNGTVVGKLEGDREATMAINDLLREDFIPADKSRGSTSTRNGPPSRRSSRALEGNKVRVRRGRPARRLCRRVLMRRRMPVITYLPRPDEAQVAEQITYLLDQGLIPAIEYARDPDPRDHYWSMWKLPLFEARAVAGVQAEIGACRTAHPDCFIKLIGYDRQQQTRAMSVLVHQP